MTAELRLKVKPPTLQRLGVPVDGLKIQGAAMVTLVNGAMEEKLPESWVTKELFQVLTRITFASDIESNVITPLKSIVP